MFERFTDSARRVVVLAQEEARDLAHDHIGTEHLLLALMRPEIDLPVFTGVDAAAVRAEVEKSLGTGKEPPGHIPFTPQAKKTLELSLREALQHGSEHIGTEHLLLGMLRDDQSSAVRILIDLDVDLKELRGNATARLTAPDLPLAALSGRRVLEDRLAAIEERLERVEQQLRDGQGGESA